MARERITGIGNNHILNGKPAVPSLRRNNMTPIACAINCTTIRMARMAVITSDNFMNMLNKNPVAHNTSSET